MYLDCKGVSLNKLIIPQFTIAAGIALKAYWPRPFGGKDELALCDALVGKTQVNGLRVVQKAAISLPHDKQFLSTPVSTLTRSLGIANDDLLQAIQIRTQGDRHALVHHLPLTLRSILALHAACGQSKFVVFNTAGLDPVGEETLVSAVLNPKMAAYGFLYLRFPDLGDASTDTVRVEKLIS